MFRSRIIFICIIIFAALQSIAQSNTYQYDNLDRLTKETYANGTEVTYTYDDVGNRLSMSVSVPSIYEPEDLDRDGVVNQDDKSLIIQAIFKNDLTPANDLNSDGVLNAIDLLYVIRRKLIEETAE